MQGKISDFGIPDIFQLVASQGKSGSLSIRGGDRETEFLFSDGQIVDVLPDRREPSSMLGNMLVDAGFLTAEELRRMLAAQEKGRKKLGEHLVEKGKISPDLLARYLLLQVRESLFDILSLPEGEYRFESFAVRPPSWMKALMRPDVLMMEGMQFLDEYPFYRGKFPPGDFRVARKRGEKVDASALSGLERAVWKSLDFSNEPRRVFRKAILTGFEGVKALAALLDRGLIEISVADAEYMDPHRAIREELARKRRAGWERAVLWAVAGAVAVSWAYTVLLSPGVTRVFAEWVNFF